MRLGVGVAAGAAFLAMLLLDTQGVLQLAWMAVLGRLGVWPQRLFVGVVVVAAGRLVVAEIRRRRPRNDILRRLARRPRPRARGRSNPIRRDADPLHRGWRQDRAVRRPGRPGPEPGHWQRPQRSESGLASGRQWR